MKQISTMPIGRCEGGFAILPNLPLAGAAVQSPDEVIIMAGGLGTSPPSPDLRTKVPNADFRSVGGHSIDYHRRPLWWLKGLFNITLCVNYLRAQCLEEHLAMVRAMERMSPFVRETTAMGTAGALSLRKRPETCVFW